MQEQTKEKLNVGAVEFFAMLYDGIDEGYITVWDKETKRTKWFHVRDKQKAADYAVARAKDNSFEVYYCVCLQKEKLTTGSRGTAKDISVMPGIWYDMDIAETNNVHAQAALPKSFDEAIDFVKAISPPPSIIVNSGHGLHAYWLFEKPLVIGDENERERCQKICSDWQEYLNSECSKRGWKGDNTSDLARLLRLPQSFNRKKGSCVEVKVIECTKARYAPDEFVRQTEQETEKSAVVKEVARDSDSMDFSGIVTGGAERLKDCRFMQYCKSHASSLTEPEWYACISNLALCKDGAKHCHSISKPHPQYKHKETADKIAHAQKAKKPITCAYIKNTLGFDCGGCTLCVKAPVALTVMSKAEQVKETLAQFPTDLKAVFIPEYLAALAHAKQNLVGEYSVIKSELKEKLGVNLQDLERAIKAVKVEQHSIAIPPEAKRLELNGLGQEFVVPQGYEVTENGIARQTNSGLVHITHYPIVIAERIRNIDNNAQKLRIKFLRDGVWTSVTENRHIVFNKSSIITNLEDYAIGVNSNNSGFVIQFLADFEAANSGRIPIRDIVSKIGWRGTEFLPLTNDSISFEADNETADIAEGLKVKGSFENWCNGVKIVRETSAISRFLFSASFAAPLMKLIDVRTFFLFIWCESMFGKSACIKAGLSAWGNAEKLQGTFNTTQIGLERKCGALNNLPYVIEERQLLNENRLDPSTVCYMFSDERSKQKGDRAGGLAETLHWKTIVIASGEQPITADSYQDGVQNRVLELKGKPLRNKIEARSVHEVVNYNYGHAGCKYITALTEKLKDGYDLRAEYIRFRDEIEKRTGSDSPHIGNIAAVALGDHLASTLVFEEDAGLAFTEAMDMAITILKINESRRKESTAARGYRHIMEWLMINHGHFDNTSYGDRYGLYQAATDKDAAVYCVYPTVLDKAVRDAGFSIEQVIEDMIATGKILTKEVYKMRDGKRTKYIEHKLHKRMYGGNPRVYWIPVQAKNEYREDFEPITGEQIPIDFADVPKE